MGLGSDVHMHSLYTLSPDKVVYKAPVQLLAKLREIFVVGYGVTSSTAETYKSNLIM